MKKLLFLLAIYALVVPSVSAQVTDSVKISTKEIELFKKALEDQAKSITGSDIKTYHRNFRRFTNVSLLLKELSAAIELIEADKEEKVFSNLIAQANNPTSDILGFKLTDKINEALDKQIRTSNVSSDKATALKSTISNLFAGLKSLFPPLQMVSSVISTISAFTSPEPTATSLATKLKKLGTLNDIYTNTKPSGVSKSFIDSLATNLAPYITFYTQLNKVNLMYESDSANMQSVAEFTEGFNSFYADFQSKTTLDFTPTRLQSSSVSDQVFHLMQFSNSTDKGFDFSAVNNREEVRYMNKAIDLVYEYVIEFNSYARNYNASVKKSVDNYITVLKSAPKDPTNTGLLQNTISSLQKSYYGTATTKGFGKKYKNKIAEITSAIRNIRLDKEAD